MEECCDECLYCSSDRCNCKNSELYSLIISEPERNVCNCFTPWWKEGYGNLGGGG